MKICVFQLRTSFLPAVGMKELAYLALLNLLFVGGGWRQELSFHLKASINISKHT